MKILAMMLLTSLCSCSYLTNVISKKSATNGDTDGAKTDKPKVITEVVTTKKLHDNLLYPARVDAGSQAAVLAESDGIVTQIKIRLGEVVKKGRSMLTLENPDPVFRYAPIDVLAPVSGVVSYLDASIGNRVERGRKLAVIADVTTVKIYIEATATDLNSLKPKQMGEFQYDSKTKQVQITAISPVVDPTSGTATVELTVMGEEATKKSTKDFTKSVKIKVDVSKEKIESAHLVPGMIGRIEFHVREREGIQVPDYAFVYKGSSPYLRVVEQGHAKWREVKLGAAAGGFTDILSGLKSGDILITRTSGFVSDGGEVDAQANKKEEVARP